MIKIHVIYYMHYDVVKKCIDLVFDISHNNVRRNLFRSTCIIKLAFISSSLWVLFNFCCLQLWFWLYLNIGGLYRQTDRQYCGNSHSPNYIKNLFIIFVIIVKNFININVMSNVTGNLSNQVTVQYPFQLIYLCKP